MSIALVRVGWILLDTTPIAVLLSVCIGVLGCLCPNFSKVFLIGTASLALKYNPPSPVSAAEDMTALIIFATVCTAQLLGGTSESFDMKKCPPFYSVHLLYLGMMRHGVLLIPCCLHCMLKPHQDWKLSHFSMSSLLALAVFPQLRLAVLTLLYLLPLHRTGKFLLLVAARIRGPFRDPQSGDRIIERVRANIAR